MACFEFTDHFVAAQIDGKHAHGIGMQRTTQPGNFSSFNHRTFNGFYGIIPIRVVRYHKGIIVFGCSPLYKRIGIHAHIGHKCLLFIGTQSKAKGLATHLYRGFYLFRVQINAHHPEVAPVKYQHFIFTLI